MYRKEKEGTILYFSLSIWESIQKNKKGEHNVQKRERREVPTSCLFSPFVGRRPSDAWKPRPSNEPFIHQSQSRSLRFQVLYAFTTVIPKEGKGERRKKKMKKI